MTVKDALRSGYDEGCGGAWHPEEQQLANKFKLAKEQVHAALCGNNWIYYFLSICFVPTHSD